MRIDIVTAFPKSFEGILSESIIKRAKSKKLVNIFIHDLRDFTLDKRRTVDDKPFGGGPGMVLKIEPIYKAVELVKSTVKKKRIPTIILSPQGRLFNQKKAEALSKMKNLILICGHYEGVDERVVKLPEAQELSIGDYILSGGEPAAAVVVDSITRLIPGVLGDSQSLAQESFSRDGVGVLDHPSFTRPQYFKNLIVPNVLLKGNHQKISAWRKKQALIKTRKNRPDLLGH